jgi:hypothetical protein
MTRHQAVTCFTVALRQPFATEFELVVSSGFASERIAELCGAHQRAYAAGRHAEVTHITVKLNVLRGLVPKRLLDLRDDTQRDHDDEREHGWSAGRR